MRDEVYQYDLSNTSNNGQNFWFAAGQNEFCYNPVTLAPYVIPARPASFLPSTPFVGLTCPVDRSIPASPVQTVHPDGKSGHLLLSNSYTPTLSQNAFTPSIGATYTLNNDTVLRVSAGRYAQEPETYQVQYNAKDNNLAYDLFQAFWQYGYTTPKHDPLVQYSNNYDASLESRIKGTDMSFKLTPYYRYATNQIYSIALPFGLSGGLNSGIERVDGVEFAFTKGDFNKNGLSFLLSYTYTNAAEQWANFPNTTINPIDPYNQDIANFNGLTKAGGGAQCYINNSITGKITADPSCAGNGNPNKGISPAIWNPYYAMAKQPLLDRNAWYPVGLDYAYLSPNTVTALVNYKHNKFTITPGVTFNEGQLYGNPASVVGLDPRTCTANSAVFLKASPKTIRIKPTTRPAAPRTRKTDRRPERCSSPIRARARSTPSASSPAVAAEPQRQLLVSDQSPHLGNGRALEPAQRLLRRHRDVVEQAVPAERLHLRLHPQLLLHRKLLQRHVAERRQSQRRPAQPGILAALHSGIRRYELVRSAGTVQYGRADERQDLGWVAEELSGSSGTAPSGDRSKNTSMCFSTYPFFQNFKGSTPSGLF